MAFLDKTGLERLWSQILSKLSNKVDKVEGKGLSTNDYTTEDKNKVANAAYKVHTHTEYDTKGAAEDALSQAKNYTNTVASTLITETKAREIMDNAVAGLVESAPDALNTLNELAAALGDDPNFATTIASQIGAKANESDLISHVSNISNPHNVTLSQLARAITNSEIDAICATF